MKLRLSTIAGVIAGLFLTTSLFGQAQITTKKEKIKDFKTKVTKIVLTGDAVFDEVFQDCISSSWTVSPYEFCSRADFDGLKANPAFYFLIVTKEQLKNEEVPGIESLSLIKGGEGADKTISDMIQLTAFPLRSAAEPSGRELVVLPVMIKAIQEQALEVTSSEVKAYTSTLSVSPKTFARLWNKQIHFSKDDIAPQVSAKVLGSLDPDMFIESDSETTDQVFEDCEYNAVISYVVAPAEPVSGSICYKMLVGADTHELYYFRKHKITATKGSGFLSSDLKLISKVRKKKN